MIPSEIKAGERYTNGYGAVRKALEIRPCGRDSVAEVDWECVHNDTKRGMTVGSKGRMTLSAFARWAKERVA